MSVKIHTYFKIKTQTWYKQGYINIIIKLMERNNYLFVDDINKCDYILTDTSNIESIPKSDNIIAKILLICINDTTNIINSARKWDKYIKYYIVHHKYRDLKNYNKKTITDRRHFNILKKIDKEDKYKKFKSINQIKLDNFDKIKLIIPQIVNYKIVGFADNVYKLKDRKIDVCFFGSLSYDKFKIAEYIIASDHRRQLYNTLNTLKSSKMGKKYNIITSKHKLDYAKYIETLKNVKIFVSPWGLGEFSHKTYEAFLCGCVIIVPNKQLQIINTPNLYNIFVECQHDFSDLKKCIKQVLNNLNSYQDIYNKKYEELKNMDMYTHYANELHNKLLEKV